MKKTRKNSIVRIFSLFAALLMLLAFVTACGGNGEETKSVFTLDYTTLSLVAGGSTSKLTLTMSDDIKDEPVWSSDNTAVATVVANREPVVGTVSGKSEGTAIITVTAGGHSASCTVTVAAGLPEATLSVVPTTLSLRIGTTGEITATTNQTAVTFTSNDTGIATVASTGDKTALVSGVAAGSTTIKVSAGGKDAFVSVTVVKPSVSLAETQVQLLAGQTKQLNATANGDLTWAATKDGTVVSVSQTGLVTAVAKGEAQVSATFGDATATCDVLVKDEIITVALSDSAKTVLPGATYQLTSIVKKITAENLEGAELSGSDAAVTWSIVSSSEAGVATISDGLITASNNILGTITVRATSAKDTDSYAECTVTVPDPYGDWIKIDSKAKLRSSFVAGNADKNMYLTGDIDMGGDTIDTLFGAHYAGILDGRGYEIYNFTTRMFMQGVTATGKLQNIAITCIQEGGSHEELFGNAGQSFLGEFSNCRFDITYAKRSDAAQPQKAAIAVAPGGTVINSLFILRGVVMATDFGTLFVQGSTTPPVITSTYIVNLTGTNPNNVHGTVVSQANASAPAFATTTGWSTDIWDFNTGSFPQLKNGGNIGEVKVEVKESTTIHLTEKETLKATVTPAKLSSDHKKVLWSSDNEAVATVNAETGEVTAVSVGSANITATSVKDNTKKAVCAVTVDIETTVSITAPVSANMEIAANLTLTGSTSPAGRGNVVWSSSDESIATVNASTGVVTAIKAGNVTITAKAASNNAKTATIDLVVKPAVAFSLNHATASLELHADKNTLQLTTTNNREADGTYTWVSSDTTVATVSSTGLVTSHKAGSATITATFSVGNVQATCDITVQPAVSVSITQGSSIEKYLNVEFTINAELRGDVTWSIIDNTTGIVSTVSTTGNSITIKGEKVGTVTVKATSVIDTSKSAQITVNISNDLTISLNHTTATLDHNQSITLIANISNNNDADIEWLSSSANITVVNGVVTALAVDGTYTITARSISTNAVSATCIVTVTYVKPVVTISENTLTIDVDDIVELITTVTPSKGTIAWTTSDSNVATVNNGSVKGIGVGTATITFTLTTTGEPITKTVNVTVNGKVDIKITNKITSLIVSGAHTFTYSDGRGGITWSSSDENVASINANGELTIHSVGTTIITATSNVYPDRKDSCTLVIYDAATINALPYKATSIGMGTSRTITTTVDHGSIVYTSSNTAVFTVNAATGEITTVGLGKATLTAASSLNSNSKTTCVIEVFAATAGWAQVSTLAQLKAVSGNFYIVNDIDLGTTTTATGSGFPYMNERKVNGLGYTVSFNYTALAEGKFLLQGSTSSGDITNATIENLAFKGTISYDSNSKACGVIATIVSSTVKNCLFEITLNSTSPYVATFYGISNSTVLNCLFLVSMPASNGTAPRAISVANPAPSDSYANKDLVPEGVNAVDNSKDQFKTTAELKKASTFATWSSDAWYIVDGEYPVLVNPGVDMSVEVVLPATALVRAGKTITLTANVKNTNNKAVVWSSLDTAIATVDAATGVVTGVAGGTARIVATSVEDPSKSATCIVEVSAKDIISQSKDSVIAKVGSAPEIVSFIVDGSSTIASVSSSDDTKATVVFNGLEVSITGLVETSSVTITVTFSDAQQKTITVKVTNKYVLAADSIALSNSNFAAMFTTANAAKNFHMIEDITVASIHIDSFAGIFDGCGYKLTLTSISTHSFNGVFGKIAETGIVQNLSIVGTTNAGFGALVANENAGLIQNLYVKFNMGFFGSNVHKGLGNKNTATGIVKNCIIEGICPNDQVNTTISSAFAGFETNNGTMTEVFSIGFKDGKEGGTVAKSAADIVVGTTDYSNWNNTIWSFVDGSMPTLIKQSV